MGTFLSTLAPQTVNSHSSSGNVFSHSPLLLLLLSGISSSGASLHCQGISGLVIVLVVSWREGDRWDPRSNASSCVHTPRADLVVYCTTRGMEGAKKEHKRDKN